MYRLQSRPKRVNYTIICLITRVLSAVSMSEPLKQVRNLFDSPGFVPLHIAKLVNNPYQIVSTVTEVDLVESSNRLRTYPIVCVCVGLLWKPCHLYENLFDSPGLSGICCSKKTTNINTS